MSEPPLWRERPDILPVPPATHVWTLNHPDYCGWVERHGDREFVWEVWCSRSANMVGSGVAESLEAAQARAEEECA